KKSKLSTICSYWKYLKEVIISPKPNHRIDIFRTVRVQNVGSKQQQYIKEKHTFMCRAINLMTIHILEIYLHLIQFPKKANMSKCIQMIYIHINHQNIKL
ncbi:erythrocyte membrane protein 1, PfEMP1, putative, partial [Plasmodium reichenowi]